MGLEKKWKCSEYNLFRPFRAGLIFLQIENTLLCVWLGTQKITAAEKLHFYKNKNGVLKTRIIGTGVGKYDAEFGK